MSEGEWVAGTATELAIRFRGVSKSYVEGVRVLSGVDLDIPHGSVTALVGANGSGKSTLVKILSGYHSPDGDSSIWIDGVSVHGSVTAEVARSAGLRFVHQDAALVSGVSVLENMLVGAYRSGPGGRVRWADERRSVEALLARWHIGNLDVRADPRELSPATASKLAVLRALRTTGDERISGLVLDEPTAALDQDDSQELLAWVRSLAVREGVGVLLIGHRIQEILTTADRVAVLRSGRIVAEAAASEFSEESLVREIVGSDIGAFYPDRTSTVERERVLSVSKLRGGRLKGVEFDLHRGEVLGITGLIGSGFEDIPYLLMDPSSGATGDITVQGGAVDAKRTSIAKRLSRGIALVPAERKSRALAVDLSLRENVALPRLKSFVRHGRLSRRAEASDTNGLLARFGVTPPDSRLAASNLSGGNQQKVVLAKWMSVAPAVLVIHEPTIGVDVGAKAEIFRLIAESAKAGLSTLVVSVEYEDLARICDRVLVINGGVIAAELEGAALSAETITAAALRSVQGSE
jgi:ribose transport system ATP-binding protein